MIRALLVLLLSLGAGCWRPLENVPPATRRTLYLSGTAVADLEETRAGARVRRESALVPGREDRSVVEAMLDERGFVVEARYVREGPRGGREVRLITGADGRRWLERPRVSRRASLSARPAVLLDTLAFVTVRERTEVELVDLSSGERTSALVLPVASGVVLLDAFGCFLARADQESGRRVGPGAFEEARGPPESPSVLDVSPRVEQGRDTLRGAWRLDGVALKAEALALVGPGQALVAEPSLGVRVARELEDQTPPLARHLEPELFVEADDPRIVAFARTHARGGAAADAFALAEAIADRLETSKGGGPPSGLRTLERFEGDCDDATALLTASLRALGHPARAVVGYRLLRGRLSPHAWSEVYTKEGWLPVDALVPGLGPFETHLRLFEGLGSPLTVGRVLGLLRPMPIEEG